ncbi:MAG TPA: MBL fold metallo-hydrolase [Anaerolineales bacterium]|jgi:L-ascorbate metabolism protein UlaG (beta-lactamase superfamily)|nr:MBL fold metallo-hydrolase [Anaerolineales bacterium]
MEIVWYGLSCFRMKERGLATVVTDPYDTALGLPALKLTADVVTISHDSPGHNNFGGVKGERLRVTGPGEYEVGGVFITGISMAAKGQRKNGKVPNTLYVFEFEGLTVAHLGDLAYVPTQAQIEDLGPVDIALVPVGGGEGLTPAEAAEVISLIEPSLVVPMQFKTGGEKIKLGQVAGFLSEMGIGKQEPQERLTVTKSGLSDQTQVVVLQRSA